MGTFHHDKGEYHGITIVVDTPGPTAYIGRCDTFTADGVILLDADVYEPGADRPSKEAWIAKAAKVGIWKKFDRVFVPNAEIAGVQRLGEVATQ